MADVVPWAVKATDDIFGILALAKTGGGTLADVLKIKPTSRTPIAKSASLAKDCEGDNVAKTVYGASTTMYEASSEFQLVSGSLLLSDLFLGSTATSGITITGIDVNTSNTDWPTITITGQVGKTLEAGPTGYLNKWALPGITVNGTKCAQDFGGGGSGELGFDAPTDCKTTGSGLNFTVDFSETTDGEGLPVAFKVSGADATMTAEFVAVTDLDAYIPAWTLDTAAGYLWINLANPGTSKTPNEYWTGSAQATIADPATNLTRTVDPS